MCIVGGIILNIFGCWVILVLRDIIQYIFLCISAGAASGHNGSSEPQPGHRAIRSELDSQFSVFTGLSEEA